MKTLPLPILASELGEFEFINSVRCRVFTGDIRSSEVSGLLDLFAKDIAGGVIHVAPISTAVFDRARQLSRSYVAQVGVRALDVLHVASAMVQKADTLCTFDRNQSKLAHLAGLKVP
jgi:hypothetical protein